jgi:hypothetical protein
LSKQRFLVFLNSETQRRPAFLAHGFAASSLCHRSRLMPLIYLSPCMEGFLCRMKWRWRTAACCAYGAERDHRSH